MIDDIKYQDQFYRNEDYKRLLLINSQIISNLKKICSKKYKDDENEQESVVEEAELILNLYQI